MNVLYSTWENPAVLIWGWVLVHFLWQGAVVALAAWQMLSICSPSSAQVRYLIATGCFFVAAACPLLTWFNLAPTDVGTTRSAEVTIGSTAEPFTWREPLLISEFPESGMLEAGSLVSGEHLQGEHAVVAPERQLVQSVDWRDRLELVLPWLVAAWFVGVLLFSLRLVGGWWFVRRLISQGEPLPAQWASVAKRLLEQMQIGRAIRWFQSSRVQVPQVVGWWKPVIFVPTSLFTTLTPQEIECLLIHELAHIRRHDFVINLFQCLVETFFFFHPGVWWLSRRIRLERELACDETVVQITGDRVSYSQALLSLARFAQLPNPTLAATESDLSKRVHAILGLRRAGTAQVWTVLLCVAACVITAGVVMSMNRAASQSAAELAVAEEQRVAIERFVEEGTPVPELSGVVVNEAGKPIPGAVVYLRQHGRSSHSSGGPIVWEDLARMTSDSEGRFRFTDVLDSDTSRRAPMFDVVAFKEGYALGWKHVRPKPAGATLRVTLKPPATITGRVVDESGESIEDATVQLKHLMSIRHITQADLEQGRWPSWKDSNFVSLHGFRKPPSTITDQDGRFQLIGAVAGSGAFLEASHPDYQLKDAFTATVSELDAETAAKVKRDVQTGEMSIALKKGYRVEISVLDDETGKPIKGTRYAPTHKSFHIPPRQRAEEGIIQINHLPTPKFHAIVYPPEQSEYLAYQQTLAWPADQYVHQVEVRLKKGIPVRGQVTGEAGQGIAGVQVYVKGPPDSFPRLKKLGLIPAQPFVTDQQGEFTAYLLPGDYSFYPSGRIRGYLNSRDAGITSPMISVHSRALLPPVLELLPAPRFQFVVTDPDGNPAPGINIFASAHLSLNSSFPIKGTTNEKGEYLLDQLFMRKSPVQDLLGEEVVFWDRGNNLGARLILERPKQGSPIEQTVEVRLEKLGRVIGRTVNEETGEPVAGTSIWLYKQDHQRNGANAVGEFTETDADGRFELKGVLPGVEHSLSMRHTRHRTPNSIKLHFQLAESKVFDFGEIKLGSLAPPDVPELATVVAPDVAGLSAAEAFEKLESTYKKAYQSYRDQFTELNKQYSSSDIVMRREPTAVYCKAFLKLAQRDPESDIAFKSYRWIVNSPLSSGNEKEGRAARTEASVAIVENFLDRPEIAKSIRVAVTGLMEKPLRYMSSDNDGLIAAAEKLMKRNPHRDVHAAACYFLVERLMYVLKGDLGHPGESVPLKTVDQCRHYLGRLKDEFPEYDHFLYGTYGKMAERLLYDIDHLLVGKIPPDLVGTDVRGTQVKLSDFRGKMVIVDFWQGVGPATHDHGGLKHIMTKAGDRVAVFGVVSSPHETVLAEVEKRNITYPVFADGKRGPFFTKWNIHSWPTTILLDEQGTILHRGHRGSALESILIDKLAEKLVEKTP